MTKERNKNLRKPRRRKEIDEKVLYEMIEKKAFDLYQQRGGEHGRDFDDWIEA